LTSLLRDARFRAAVAQAVVLALLVWLVGNAVWNALDAMARQGMSTGFGFLGRPAGFEVPQALLPYVRNVSSAGRAVGIALLNTLVVFVASAILATLFGFVAGIARLSPNPVLWRAAAGYVGLARNLPLLLVVFFFYFGVIKTLPAPRNGFSVLDLLFLNNRGLTLPVPKDGLVLPGYVLYLVVLLILWRSALRLLARRAERRGGGTPALLPFLAFLAAALAGAAALAALTAWDIPRRAGFNVAGGTTLIPECVALIVALATYYGTYIAEIVRGGVLSVGSGQVEAARALGLRRGLMLRLVIVPQAMRAIVPPLTSQYVNIVKNSALGATIGYPELFTILGGKIINETGQAIEPIALLVVIYFAVNAVVSALMNLYNRRVQFAER
jgi:general L-amino acid transport system permease protein